MLLLGLYGFLPKLPRRSETITFAGAAGEVTIQLDTVEKGLTRVLQKMDEVKKVKIKVKD